MALAPRDVPITRENVVQWYRNWRRTRHRTHKDFETYLRERVDALGLEDQMVATPNHDDLSQETHVVDMILADLASYGITDTSN